ncbi:MAG: ATP-binding cassette domain-containing protein [Succinivibrionaceae bacterium]|nr:ATP-binding cassette domain-containing protein [Succinivibrionaceae bacterium]
MIPCLTVRGLSLRREKNGSAFTLEVPALDLYPGQVLAVVGPSGCGKSTLCDLIALIQRPDSCESFTLNDGSREVDILRAGDNEIAALRGSALGYVLQSGGLFGFLDVMDNILLPGRLLGLAPGPLLERARAIAAAMGITPELRQKPSQLSGGQRQRAAIARALIHDPRLVLADEPTAAVDSYNAREICKIFRKIAELGNTAILIVSHDRQLVEEYADFGVGFSLSRDADGGMRSVLGGRVALRGAGAA